MAFNKADYFHLLEAFKIQGYSFIPFHKLDLSKNRQIILRHDIDFSLDYAVEMAAMEYDTGIRSTYFPMLSSPFYNLFEARYFIQAQSLQRHHDLGLQIDIQSAYRDSHYEIFHQIFPKAESQVMSVHRPGFHRMKSAAKTSAFVYDEKYFKQIKYVSDSRCVFREGDPLESEWFKRGDNVQMLIHPIWWMEEGPDAAVKLDNAIAKIGNGLYNRVVNDFDILPKG
jgi:hypothetical protein